MTLLKIMKMESIKISVEVSVNLSESTQDFIKSLFVATVSKPAVSVEAKPVVEPTTPAVSIEDVRQELVKKVNAHREEIKAKLTEFGAPSVTKLDPSKYEEMYNFLTSL